MTFRLKSIDYLLAPEGNVEFSPHRAPQTIEAYVHVAVIKTKFEENIIVDFTPTSNNFWFY
jgi:hypothetical protein